MNKLVVAKLVTLYVKLVIPTLLFVQFVKEIDKIYLIVLALMVFMRIIYQKIVHNALKIVKHALHHLIIVQAVTMAIF